MSARAAIRAAHQSERPALVAPPVATPPGPVPRPLPAYLQIEAELADRIETGELRPGDRVPTERELCAGLGVSRMTVRAGLARLEQRGLIVRRQGSGTFVAPPKLRQDASHLRGFFEASVGQGLMPVSRIIATAEVPATRHLAGELGLRIGEPVHQVVRLRAANGVPTVLETSYLPAHIFRGLLAFDLERSSIYRLMDQRYDARPVRARQSLEAVAASPEEAALLETDVGSPLVLVQRTAWDRRGRPVEHARDVYRGDRSQFVGELTLAAAPEAAGRAKGGGARR
jgi:GntR family transcriptional regulator